MRCSVSLRITATAEALNFYASVKAVSLNVYYIITATVSNLLTIFLIVFYSRKIHISIKKKKTFFNNFKYIYYGFCY